MPALTPKHVLSLTSRGCFTNLECPHFLCEAEPVKSLQAMRNTTSVTIIFCKPAFGMLLSIRCVALFGWISLLGFALIG